MTNDHTIIYRSFTLAKANGMFQEELYPNFEDNKASNDYKSWAAGTDVPPNMRRLTEADFTRR